MAAMIARWSEADASGQPAISAKNRRGAYWVKVRSKWARRGESAAVLMVRWNWWLSCSTWSASPGRELLELVLELLEPVDVDRAEPPYGVAGQVGGDEGVDAVHVLDVAAGQGEHDEAASGLPFDEALAAQLHHRLAHGRDAHAHLLGEVLEAQEGAGLHLAGDDLLSDAADHVLAAWGICHVLDLMCRC